MTPPAGESMDDVGGVITSQVDLLWSVSLAMLLAGVFVAQRFLQRIEQSPRADRLSRVLLYTSIVFQFASMVCGYFTYGAVVNMGRCTPSEGGAVDDWCTRNLITTAVAFDSAQLMALLQCGAFAAGLLLFVFLCLRDRHAVAMAVKN